MFHFIITSLFLSSFVKCDNILIISGLFSYSHDSMHAVIAEKLAESGHNVTLFLQYNVFGDKAHHSNVNLHFIEAHREDYQVYFGDRNPKCFKYCNYGAMMAMRLIRDQIKHHEMQRIIHDQDSYKFDLIILECISCSLLQLGIAYDCPVIQFQASEYPNYFYDSHMKSYLNAAVHTSTGFSPTKDVPLTFQERIKSLLEGLVFSHALNNILKYSNYKLLMKNCPNCLNISSWRKLPTKPQMAVLGTKILTHLGQVRPFLPNKIVNLGYSHIKEPKSLSNGEIKDFLDQSTKDVILVSFGSVIKTETLHFDLIMTLINTFRQLPQYNFIWKAEIEDLREIPDNVLTLKWLPIADILAHPKIKLFITHGGLRSLEEGIERKIPMLIIPIFLDQFVNADLMVQNEIAEQLDINSITESSFTEGITKMMENYDFYKENLQQFHERTFDEMITSLNDAIWKIESVMKFGNYSEFFETFDVPFYQRYYLDIYLFLAILTYIIIKVLKLFKRFIIVTFNYFQKRFNRRLKEDYKKNIN